MRWKVRLYPCRGTVRFAARVETRAHESGRSSGNPGGIFATLGSSTIEYIAHGNTLPGLPQESAEIIRHRRLENKSSAGLRPRNTQAQRMEPQAGAPRSVAVITNDGMSQPSQVGTDLMLSPGFQLNI